MSDNELMTPAELELQTKAAIGLPHQDFFRYQVGKNGCGKRRSLLDIYAQSDSPGAGKQSNWLSVPNTGTFSLVSRLYGPMLELLQMRWKMPMVEKRD